MKLKESLDCIAAELVRCGEQLATAESCTGGWIAQCVTDRPGSSAWYAGSVVAYCNALKRDILDVRVATLAQAGAVSADCAEQMARGVAHRLRVAQAVATTGIAGPEGGTPDKPVGTVWFAWYVRGQVSSECRRFTGDRTAVRCQSVEFALAGLAQRLRERSAVP